LLSRKGLKHAIESYLQLNEIEHLPSPVDIPMDTAPITPKPMQIKKEVVEESENDGRDLQVESEDDFETLKPLKRNHLIMLSSEDDDLWENTDIGRTKFDSDEEMPSESDSQNKESEDELDNLNKESEDERDLQGFQKIDLTKAHTRNGAKKKKDKRGFRKQVEERQALVEENNKKAG